MISIYCLSYAVSAMTGALYTGYLTGRPYGGVGFIWHKSLGNKVSILGSDRTKRCIVLLLKLIYRILWQLYCKCLFTVFFN